MATVGAAVDYHESIYTEIDAQAARRAKADRVLALEVAALKRDVADINTTLAKLTEMVARATNLAHWHGEEVGYVEMLLTETVSRVQAVEEQLVWDAHDGRTMYGAPELPLVDAAE